MESPQSSERGEAARTRPWPERQPLPGEYAPAPGAGVRNTTASAS
jgi:hypothetical protein